MRKARASPSSDAKVPLWSRPDWEGDGCFGKGKMCTTSGRCGKTRASGAKKLGANPGDVKDKKRAPDPLGVDSRHSSSGMEETTHP